MSKTYRPWAPNQSWLLPPSPQDWPDEGDRVYFYWTPSTPWTCRPSAANTTRKAAAIGLIIPG